MIRELIIFKMRLHKLITALVFIFALVVETVAQEPPPRPISISITPQTLSFGAFYHGPAGGSVIIDPAGTRSSTGDVVPLGLGYSFSSAMFEVHADPGTLISVLNSADATLLGTPAGTMTLKVGFTSPSSPFVSNVQYNVAIPLYVGGTLIVGSSAANPPGTYTGTFDITIVRE